MLYTFINECAIFFIYIIVYSINNNFFFFFNVCDYIAHNKKKIWKKKKSVGTYIVFYSSFLYWSEIVNTDLRKLKKQYSCRIHFADSPRKNSPFYWFLFFFFFFNYHLWIVRQDFCYLLPFIIISGSPSFTFTFF